MSENFKEMAGDDIMDVFFDREEFGEVHQVDGKPMTIIIDGYEVVERGKKQSEKERINGIYKKQILFYVYRKEMGRLPAIGRTLQLDNSKYLVTDDIDEGGVFSITMEAVKS